MHEGDRDDQLNPEMRGNSACLQCHESFAAELTEHTHHPPDSPGSNCYNCHMPHTSYGLYKAIRSHQISSPSVRSSVEAGRPNGCNLCHLDRTLQWTAEHLTNWYGQPVVPLSDDQRSISAALLWLLRGDAVQRAIIAWVMGWEPAQQASGSDWLPAYLSFLLQDPYSAVRYIAYHSLRRLPGFGEIEYDFIGPEKDRRRVGLETLRTWTQEHSHKLSRSGPDILIRADGTMMSEDVVRILMQRDDRRLFVAE